MGDPRLPATFDHVAERDQVVPDVGVRVDERIAHARLRGKINCVRERVIAEQALGCLRVCEVDAFETKARTSYEARDARLLERDVVIRIEVVDAKHRHTRVEELRSGVHADEAGAAGDEHAANRGAGHCGSTAESARSFAYFMKL